MKQLIFLIAAIAIAFSQQFKEDVKFPDNTPVIMLDEDNWDSMTKLGTLM